MKEYRILLYGLNNKCDNVLEHLQYDIINGQVNLCGIIEENCSITHADGISIFPLKKLATLKVMIILLIALGQMK